MSQSVTSCLILVAGLLLYAAPPVEADGVRVVFMEPAGEAKEGDVPTYRTVLDSERGETYMRWLAYESPRMALELYERAWRIFRGSKDEPVYYIALIPNGNHAALGFRLQTEAGVESHEQTAYIKLDPSERTFANTLLHETGHVVLYMLNDGDGIPVRPNASIPHTTAALTDRGTAFNEGFAIHLETLAAHIGTEPLTLGPYRRRGFTFGVPGNLNAEYFRKSRDLMTYAQSRSRYYDVRENHFAFASAFKGPDYLRVQLDPSRDFATVRDANQLLQSEGFYATFFFDLLMRGEERPSAATIRERQGRMLAVLSEVLRSGTEDAETPYLLRFLETYVKRYPNEGGEVVDLFHDITHGVFVDANAAALWREHYLGALRLDLAERNNPKIAKARTGWHEKVLADPKILYSRLGPQIPVEVPAVEVLIVAFGQPAPLAFDLNTAEEGILRAIPGITDAQVGTWLSERSRQPFASREDFERRVPLDVRTRAGMNF